MNFQVGDYVRFKSNVLKHHKLTYRVESLIPYPAGCLAQVHPITSDFSRCVSVSVLKLAEPEDLI
jgi:hypothetical protein